jgi:NO-binding membrane sensor protein with MHYT domain
VVGTYNLWLVALSVLVAIFVSYTALRLSARVAQAKAEDSMEGWLAGGAVAMGAGIWSMHFVGMLAFSLPIPLTYDLGMTAASLIIAIIISGFALVVASRPEISLAHLSVAALILAAGICGMHYTGMAAVEIAPMITYELGLVIASIVIAVVASFAALWLFFHLRQGNSLAMRLARVGAAFVMGFAITGMHYTAMAASQFSARSVCTSPSNVSNVWLAFTTAAVAVAVLGITTVVLVRDARQVSANSAV